MLKKSLINLHTKTALKRNAAKRESILFSEVKKIGIVHSYVSQEEIKSVYHFFDQLEKSNIKVEVLILKNKETELNIPEFIIADEQELTQFGKWNNEDIKGFFNEHFDYLIHLNLEENELVENILALSKAKCRVGKYFSDKEKYYELMISPEEDNIRKLIDQIFHYIQII